MNRQTLAIKESEELSEIGREMGWNIQYDQTEPGRFAGNVEAAETGEIQFIHERHSRALCIDSMGAPTSATAMPRRAAVTGPMVLPQPRSLRATKSCSATPQRSARRRIAAPDAALVA